MDEEVSKKRPILKLVSVIITNNCFARLPPKHFTRLPPKKVEYRNYKKFDLKSILYELDQALLKGKCIMINL